MAIGRFVFTMREENELRLAGFVPKLASIPACGVSMAMQQSDAMKVQQGTPMRPPISSAVAILLAGFVLAGCAGGDSTGTLPATPNLAEKATALNAGKAMLPLAFAAAASSGDSDELSCKKLTGLVQVRLLQLRDYEKRTKVSLVSRSMQFATAHTVGGTQNGIHPEQEHAADLAALKSYNDQLAAKGCKSFDIAKELEVDDAHETPNPVIAPPKEPGVTVSEQ